MAGSPLKKARRLAAAARPTDPLDEAPPRPSLRPIPWNRVELTGEQRDLVAGALADGYPRKDIAAALGVSVRTLRRIIEDDEALTDAVESADQAELEEVRSLLLAHGRAGDTVALIFLAKAFHGLRDRDDAAAAKLAAVKTGGVLLLPADVPLDEWEAATARQQAQYRERPVDEPANDFGVPPKRRSPGIEGLTLEKP